MRSFPFDLRMDFTVIATMTPQLIDAFAQNASADETSRGNLVLKLDNAVW